MNVELNIKENTTANLNLNQRNKELCLDSTLAVFRHKSSAGVIRHLLTLDSSMVSTHTVAGLKLSSGGYVGLAAGVDTIIFTTGLINMTCTGANTSGQLTVGTGQVNIAGGTDVNGGDLTILVLKGNKTTPTNADELVLLNFGNPTTGSFDHYYSMKFDSAFTTDAAPGAATTKYITVLLGAVEYKIKADSTAS